MKKSSICVKHAYSGDKVNLFLCCKLKHDYFKPKCHNLHNFKLILVSFQRISLQTADRNNSGWCQIQQS